MPLAAYRIAPTAQYEEDLGFFAIILAGLRGKSGADYPQPKPERKQS